MCVMFCCIDVWIKTAWLAPLKSNLVSVLDERSLNFCTGVCFCFHQLDLVKCEVLVCQKKTKNNTHPLTPQQNTQYIVKIDTIKYITHAFVGPHAHTVTRNIWSQPWDHEKDIFMATLLLKADKQPDSKCVSVCVCAFTHSVQQVRLSACKLGQISCFNIRLGPPPRLKTPSHVNLAEEAWVSSHALSFLLFSQRTNHLHCPYIQQTLCDSTCMS